MFKEVCPAVATQISEQLETLEIAPEQLKRMWLHQANLSMNQLISKRVLGREATQTRHPPFSMSTPTPAPPARSSPFTSTADFAAAISGCCAPLVPATVLAAWS